MAPVLQGDVLTKSFGGVLALDRVSFDLEPGEIHTLAGENGSGKSTLLKLFAGIHRPDAGSVLIDGREVSFSNAREARDEGVALVTQEGSVLPQLSVAENIFLGRQRRRRAGVVDWGATRRAALKVLERLELDLDPRTLVGSLPADKQQLVEIGRAISQDARVILLDESTSSLDRHEVDALFRVLRGLSDSGVALVFISHRMSEMLALGDRYTVLRDGRRVTTTPRAAVTEDGLVKAMVGRELSALYPSGAPAVGAGDGLEIRELSDLGGHVRGASLTVRAGEVVGLAGLVGAGRTELLESVLGTRPRVAGEVLVGGQSVGPGPVAAIRAGLALLADDRQAKGTVAGMSVRDNVLLASRPSGQFRRRGAEAAETRKWIERLAIRCPGPGAPIASLSGGNQQKALLARILNTRPKAVMMDEPTRGVDIGAKAEIYRLIKELAGDGTAVLVASSELSELFSVCHRILVMRAGRIVADIARNDATEELIVAHATGAAVPDAA